MQTKFRLMAGALVAYALATLALVFFLTQAVYTPSNMALLAGSTRLPNMKAISDIPTRKDTFIGTLEPLIETKNEKLLALRGELSELQQQVESQQPLDRRQQARLARLTKRYNVDLEQMTHAQAINTLLTRIDIIPPSMVLAQAAAESGWGTSRFAREAQNLFGQWCYRKGCGLVPKRRSAGATHEVRKFKGVEQAINAYYQNINSHRAYRQVRQLRANLRAADKPISGPALIAGLTQYSSRGQPYVDELAELIRYNNLERFDG